jgi:hypothetical protein
MTFATQERFLQAATVIGGGGGGGGGAAAAAAARRRRVMMMTALEVSCHHHRFRQDSKSHEPQYLEPILSIKDAHPFHKDTRSIEGHFRFQRHPHPPPYPLQKFTVKLVFFGVQV